MYCEAIIIASILFNSYAIRLLDLYHISHCTIDPLHSVKIFNGLSAELISNRLFSLQPAGTSWPVAWPAGVPPHWTGVNGTVPFAFGPSQAATCALVASGSPCGIQQVAFDGGFNGGVSFGSSIGLLAGLSYRCRVFWFTHVVL